jgi:hypothetical protein
MLRRETVALGIEGSLGAVVVGDEGIDFFV